MKQLAEFERLLAIMLKDREYLKDANELYLLSPQPIHNMALQALQLDYNVSYGNVWRFINRKAKGTSAQQKIDIYRHQRKPGR